MSGKKNSYKNHTLEDVSSMHSLWANGDPVRPGLTSYFKTSKGRKVYGLKSKKGSYDSFICIARTSDIPIDERTLDHYSVYNGSIAIAYSVWSLSKGAGREIVNRVLSKCFSDPSIDRVITLSPTTQMARNFHLSNNAIELRVNRDSVNFEYLKD